MRDEKGSNDADLTRWDHPMIYLLFLLYSPSVEWCYILVSHLGPRPGLFSFCSKIPKHEKMKERKEMLL